MNSQHLQNQIERLHRRILMQSAPIKITATDDDGPVHKIQARVQGTPEVMDDISVVQIYGLASHAPPGTDATAMFVGGDRSNAMIVATNNQKSRLRKQKAGEVALYTDEEGVIVQLARDKTIIIKAEDGEVRIETKKLIIKCEEIEIESDKIAIKGNIELDGNLNATGRVNWQQSGGGGPTRE